MVSLTSTNAPPSEVGTASAVRSDAGSTRAASSSVKDASSLRPSVSPASSRPVIRPAVPAVTPSKQPIPITTKAGSPLPATNVPDKEDAVQDADRRAAEPLDASPKPSAVPVAKLAPKSWADLVRSNTPQGSSAASSNSLAIPAANSTSAASKSHAVADVIRDFNVNHGGKLAFLEPRGLVNTGNMCYMNSVGIAVVSWHFANFARFFKFSSTARRSTICSIRLASEHRTASKAKLQFSMPCRPQSIPNLLSLQY
jgi:ubiquitin carboxyl-terminal hydrolase 10